MDFYHARQQRENDKNDTQQKKQKQANLHVQYVVSDAE